MNGTYDWSRAVPLFMFNACNDPIIPYDPAYQDFLTAAAPKFFTQDPSGGHAAPLLLVPDTYPAFLARYVAGDASAGPLGVLLAATSDPLFAYDFGNAVPVRTMLPPCVRFTG